MADSRLILRLRCRPLPGSPLAPPTSSGGAGTGEPAPTACRPRPDGDRPAPCALRPARAASSRRRLPGLRLQRARAEERGSESWAGNFWALPLRSARPARRGDPLSASTLTPSATALGVGPTEAAPLLAPSSTSIGCLLEYKVVGWGEQGTRAHLNM